jgi:hypothetical protein
VRGETASKVQVERAERRHVDHQPELVDRHDHAGGIGGIRDRHPHQHRGHQRAERCRHRPAEQGKR